MVIVHLAFVATVGKSLIQSRLKLVEIFLFNLLAGE